MYSPLILRKIWGRKQRTDFTESAHLNSPNTENFIFYIHKEAYFYKHFSMKSHIVKKGPVIILDVNLLFGFFPKHSGTFLQRPGNTWQGPEWISLHFPNVLGEEVMQMLLFASLGWGQLPRHLLEYYLYWLVLLFEMSRLTSDSLLAGWTQRASQKLSSPSQSQYI